MPNEKILLTTLPWVFLGASIISMGLAVWVQRGTPLKVIFSIGGADKIPKEFFLLLGVSFVFLSGYSLLQGTHILTALLLLQSFLQFLIYRSTTTL